MNRQDKTPVITDSNGNTLVVDLLPVASNNSINTAVFGVNIPAAGFSTYFLEYTSDEPAATVEPTVCRFALLS